MVQPEQILWFVASLPGGGSTGAPAGLSPWQALLNQFMNGALVMACAAAGFFFLRFWRKTRDRLFAIFAFAFWVLGVHWTVLALTPGMDEVHAVLYTIRLLAFLLILFAILDKNRTRPMPGQHQGGKGEG